VLSRCLDVLLDISLILTSCSTSLPRARISNSFTNNLCIYILSLNADVYNMCCHACLDVLLDISLVDLTLWHCTLFLNLRKDYVYVSFKHKSHKRISVMLQELRRKMKSLCGVGTINTMFLSWAEQDLTIGKCDRKQLRWWIWGN